MSSLNVHDINGISTYGNEVRIPSGSNLNVQGEIDAGTVEGPTLISGTYYTVRYSSGSLITQNPYYLNSTSDV